MAAIKTGRPSSDTLWEFLWVSLLEVNDQESSDARLQDLYADDEPPLRFGVYRNDQ